MVPGGLAVAVEGAVDALLAAGGLELGGDVLEFGLDCMGLVAHRSGGERAQAPVAGLELVHGVGGPFSFVDLGQRPVLPGLDVGGEAVDCCEGVLGFGWLAGRPVRPTRTGDPTRHPISRIDRMAEPAWIVLDTNFASRGKYQSARLRKVVERLVARGHDIVIPEVVVWEWAEHLHRKLVVARELADSAAVDLKAAGLGARTTPLEVPSPQAICDHITADLNSMDGLVVHVPDFFDAADAIRDQVLQVGMGSRRGGTKTGAADSLVLAAAVRTHDFDDGNRPVVLCTNDSELAKAAGRSPTPLVVICDLGDLWRWHGTTQPLDDDLANAIRRWLVDVYASAVDGTLRQLTIDPMELGRIDHHLLRVAADLDHRTDAYQLEVQLQRFDEVWVTDVEVVDGDELPHLVIATVTAVGEVVIDDWFFNADGDLEHDQGAAQAQTTTEVVAAFDERWTITDVEVAEVAQVRPLGDDEPRWGSRTPLRSSEQTA